MMKPQSAIVFSGGYGHPFEQSTEAIAAIVSAKGIAVSIETDLDKVLGGLAQNQLLIVNALYWSMMQDEKYEPHRDEWAFRLQADQLATIQEFVEQGGGLFALHTAAICFDTQPGWLDLLGGGWRWNRSWHPPLAMVKVELVNLPNHPFDIIDECYHNLDPAPDARVWATCAISDGPQPVAWTRHVGVGRVAVNTLGHDARSINTAGHRQLIAAMFDWLL